MFLILYSWRLLTILRSKPINCCPKTDIIWMINYLYEFYTFYKKWQIKIKVSVQHYLLRTQCGTEKLTNWISKETASSCWLLQYQFECGDCCRRYYMSNRRALYEAWCEAHSLNEQTWTIQRENNRPKLNCLQTIFFSTSLLFILLRMTIYKFVRTLTRNHLQTSNDLLSKS